MKISIITLFPELYNPFLNTSLISRATQNGVLDINLKSLFDYTKAKERIDSPTFGHGSGMLIKPDIVKKSIEEQEASFGSAYKIFFSPQGKKLDQDYLKCIYAASKEKNHIMLLPARYEGMDSRVEQYYADEIISIGDYVLMGGDLPAMVFMEAFTRLVPEVVGKTDSVEHESFSASFVDYPEFTEPIEWNGLKVPEVIRSGNHQKVNEWRLNEAAKKTVFSHFDWLKGHVRSGDISKAQEFIPSHYAILMHDNVMLESGRQGTSSVTSIDIHDIARSSATFGIKKYFIVTPLVDQKKIVNKLLDFWTTDVGISYNQNRHEAIKNVILVDSLDAAINKINELENKKPILLATAARSKEHKNFINYFDQSKVWSHNKPVAIIFGTARGLAQEIVDSCDYLLEPIIGFSKFNHLSVRSAAAIVFDRWLGINRVIKQD